MDAQRLQIGLGKIRQTLGHFEGKVLAIYPHRIKSYSKRQMVRRKKNRKESEPCKTAQTFFCLDVGTKQPICFTSCLSAKTVTQATQELLPMVANILRIDNDKPLVMADNEHYTVELFDWVYGQTPFDMLVPMPWNSSVKKAIAGIEDEAFK